MSRPLSFLMWPCESSNVPEKVLHLCTRGSGGGIHFVGWWSFGRNRKLWGGEQRALIFIAECTPNWMLQHHQDTSSRVFGDKTTIRSCDNNHNLLPIMLLSSWQQWKFPTMLKQGEFSKKLPKSSCKSIAFMRDSLATWWGFPISGQEKNIRVAAVQTEEKQQNPHPMQSFLLSDHSGVHFRCCNFTHLRKSNIISNCNGADVQQRDFTFNPAGECPCILFLASWCLTWCLCIEFRFGNSVFVAFTF